MTGTVPCDLHTDAPRAILALRRFLVTPAFLLILTAAGFLVTAFSLEVPAAVACVCLIAVILCISDDVFATTGPFLLMTVMVSACYDSYSVFIVYLPLVLPVLAALCFHFIFYRGHYRLGYSFAALAAVSAAVTLGGIGCLSAAEYFTPAALYYVVSLGFGMLGIYLLLKAQLSRKREYDPRSLLLLCLYLCAIYAAFFTLHFYLERLVWMRDDLEIFGHLRLISIDRRNVYATYLMLGLPAPFYFAAKGKEWHLIPGLLIYGCLLLTGSRGGMLMGSILFGLCFIYLLRRNRKHRVFHAVLVGALVTAALCSAGFLFRFYSFRFENGFIEADEPRMLLLRRAVRDFLSHPVFGVGLGYTGNADIYNPKTFAMNWYHMMIPQIVAGLGIVGTLAFAFLFFRRAVLIRRTGDLLSRSLSLSYIGLFLMSQVNPGEFCPMPYELIAVMIFLLLENQVETEERHQEKITGDALCMSLSHALFGTPLSLPPDRDDAQVLRLSEAHMVFGVLGEAWGDLPEDSLPAPVLFRLQELTVTLMRQNAVLEACRDGLCRFLLSRNIPAVILKGDSVACLYPIPEDRVSGDIDCLVNKCDLPLVAAYLTENGFEAVPGREDHHAVYRRGPCEVELHFAVPGLPSGQVGEKLRDVFADLTETAVTAEIHGNCFPVPDPFHQALILLLHMQQHMREGGIGLRQVTDFALFAAREWDAALTSRLTPVLHECGLYRFAAIVLTACVRHLGLKTSPLPEAPADLADALFADFLAGGNFGNGNEAYAGSASVTLSRGEKHRGGAFGIALSGVCEKCRVEWPATARHPVLLGIFVPFWILRRLCRKGRHVRPYLMLRSAAARGDLYDQLHLFDPE